MDLSFHTIADLDYVIERATANLNWMKERKEAAIARGDLAAANEAAKYASKTAVYLAPYVYERRCR